MTPDVRLAIALAIVIASDVFVQWVKDALHWATGVEAQKKSDVDVLITGTFERALAFCVSYFQFPDAGTILAAWAAAKLAIGWERVSRKTDKEEERKVQTNALISLISGVVSLGLGYYAGWLARP